VLVNVQNTIKRSKAMDLATLKEHQKAIIKSINCSDELKQRFYSFGIIQGEHIIMNNISLSNNTMIIDVDGTEVAIRIEEAKHIKIQKL
jgi:Fe2+ transport system protein FeoA